MGPTISHRVFWTLAALSVAIVVLLGAVMPKPANKVPVGTKIEKDGRTTELLARTPAGDEVWQVKGDGLVVPSVFVVSRTGAVAHR